MNKFLGPEPMHPLLARILILLTGVVLGMVFIAVQNVYVQAAAPTGGGDVAECVEWGKMGKWTLTRCEDAYTGEVCIGSDSGMVVCKLD